MANKMLIDATHPEETRVVVLRGNRVEEFDFESANRKQLRGNIYLAKVTRVEPSLQAAFVDYGGNRHGFLAFSEIHPDYYQIPVADRQALIAQEERDQRAADADADSRAGRRSRHRHRGAEQRRDHDVVQTEPIADDFAGEASESRPGDDGPDQPPSDAMTETPVENPVPVRRPIRVGIVRGFFYDNATAEVRTLNDILARKLAAAGFEVVQAQLPGIFEIQQSILRTILRSETSSIHEAIFAKHAEAYGPKLRMLVETGMLVHDSDYLRARRLRRKYQREMARLFERFDVLLSPAAPGTAPQGISTTGDPVMNGPWTLSDFPTMTLPYALGANGLPIGVQLTAAPLQEGMLLEIAKKIETVVGFQHVGAGF